MKKIAWPLIAVLTVASWCAAADKGAISSANPNPSTDANMQSTDQLNQSQNVSVSAKFLAHPQNTNVSAVINPLRGVLVQLRATARVTSSAARTSPSASAPILPAPAL